MPNPTLAKVLERLLSHCDNRVFEVAKWLMITLKGERS